MAHRPAEDGGIPVTRAGGSGGSARAGVAGLLAAYDRSLPHVYGYLIRRTGDVATAEDLTAETFEAALAAATSGRAPDMSTAWLVGIARHKLVDHWRREHREARRLRAVAAEPGRVEDPWDAHVDATVARAVLATLGPSHRSALTLRYVDGLPVASVAEHLQRTLHATEALLVRARAAFRAAYTAGTDEPTAPTQQAELTDGGDQDAH